ncbi:MAG: ribulose-phosphate 3-epimerase [Clostridiales bacterium 43-6]|nr:MAG: ribulose-phosphate 3-epimerase [Clostridiales bacterium 43-6]
MICLIKFSPSILTADFTKIGEAVDCLRSAGADMLHLDVMDGIFVPNISFGFPVVESLNKYTDLPLDVHLMIDRPHRYIERFAKAGADILGFHYEAGSPVGETLQQIKDCGIKSCLTIKPKTPADVVLPFLELCDMVLIMSVEPGFGGQAFMPNALDKIKLIRKEADNRGLTLDIQVDGGIDLNTAPLVTQAGANVLVLGNVLFSAENMEERLAEIRALTM